MRDGHLEADDFLARDWRPDGFNAARLIMAMIDDDRAACDRILLENPVVSLLSGLVGVALALGDHAAGYDRSKLRTVLDRLMLSPTLDGAGTADDYRKKVTP